MATASIAADIHQSLDVHVDLTTKVTFNQVAFDGFSELNYVSVFEILHADVRIDARFL